MKDIAKLSHSKAINLLRLCPLSPYFGEAKATLFKKFKNASEAKQPLNKTHQDLMKMYALSVISEHESEESLRGSSSNRSKRDKEQMENAVNFK